MDDAVRIDRDDDFCRRVLERVADRACFSAVDVVPADSDPDVGEVGLSLFHPFIAVVNGAIVLRYHFKLVVRIVALRNAFDRCVHRLAFVVARHEYADGGLVGVVLLRLGGGKGEAHDDSHQVLHDSDHEREDQEKPQKNGTHQRLSVEASLMPETLACLADWVRMWNPNSLRKREIVPGKAHNITENAGQELLRVHLGLRKAQTLR